MSSIAAHRGVLLAGGSTGDPFFSSVVALLHCNGTNASTTLTDNSSYARAFTVFGNAQISTSDSVFGGAAALLDGTGDYWRCNSATELKLGTGDFTVEGRFKTSTNNKVLVDFRPASTAGIVFYIDTSGFLGAFSNNGTPRSLLGVTNVADGAWHSFAFSRVGGTLRIFLDGALQNSASFPNDMDQVAQLFIGAQNDGGLAWNGRLDEFRITVGVGRYSSAYTPDTSEFSNS